MDLLLPLLVVFSAEFTIIFSEELMFLDYPENITAFDGERVIWNCKAKGSLQIEFWVNGTVASKESVEGAGFVEGIQDVIDSTTKQINLTATAFKKYNNTVVSCIAISIVGNKTIFGDNSSLLIQGPLKSVGDICHDFIDSSSLNISWNPPFTLPGTHITGYNISVTSIMFNISQFITDTYYVLTAPNNTDPCDGISITVSGYNGAGNGEITTISSLFFPEVPQLKSSVQVIILPVITNQMVSIMLFVNVSELCPGEYPTITDILITNSTNDTVKHLNDVLLKGESQNYILTPVDIIILKLDVSYTVQMTFSNLDGEFHMTAFVNSMTHDIQSFNITNTNKGNICVVCKFSANTTAVGCEIKLLQINISILSERFYRDVNIAEGCISNITTGYYDLYVYDVENDNTLSPLPAIIKNNIFIEQTATQMTTTIAISLMSIQLSVSTLSGNASPTLTVPETEDNNSNHLGAGIGGAIGGALIIFILAFILSVLIMNSQKRKKKHDGYQVDPNVEYTTPTEYTPESPRLNFPQAKHFKQGYTPVTKKRHQRYQGDSSDSEMSKDDSQNHVQITKPTAYLNESQRLQLPTFLQIEDSQQDLSLDENGLFHHCYKYGVTIIIPPGAVDQKCTLQFGACLTFPHFRSKESFIPVSPFVWIHIDRELKKPAELYIPHYIDISCDEDKKKLCLLTSKVHSQEEEAFTFTESDIDVDYFETSARIATTHFCSVCIASKSDISQRKRYHLLFAEKVLEDGKTQLDVCIMYSLKNCIQNVEEQYKEYKGAQDKVNLLGPVVMDVSKITIKCDPTDISGWEILHRDDYYITEQMINFYEVLDCPPDRVSEEDIERLKMYEEEMSYPPRFKLKFSPTGPKIRNTQVKLILHGLHEGSEDGPPVSHIVMLGNEDTGSSQTTPISSTSLSDSSTHDSVLCSATINAVSTPTLSDHDTASSSKSDNLVIDLMKVLELKLQNNWIEYGHHLNIPMKKLHEIEAKVGHDNNRCTNQLLFMWKDLNPDASWEPLVKALKQCGLFLLSAIVSKRYTRSRSGPTWSDYDMYEVLASIPNSPALLYTAPGSGELSNLVAAKIPAKWKLFGQQVGLDQGCLDSIFADNYNSINRFIDMLNQWKRQKPSTFKWATVIKVLYSRSIGEYSLAESVFKKLSETNVPKETEV